MSRLAALTLTLVMVAGALPALAATGTKSQALAAASFDVQGRVVAVHDGWFELSVQRVFRGKLVRGARLRVTESASTRFLRAGKPARASDLRSGATVRVAGTVQGAGNQASYNASTVTLIK
ncbi:hypothetical protein HRbin31_00556 [bacterium HR31]|nr:hypothetical protein HRbin31_00556 [bacterium HR31]